MSEKKISAISAEIWVECHFSEIKFTLRATVCRMYVYTF